jgi:AcrR family transcriptional regulator
MSALADAASVSRATLYRYFGSRDALIASTARFAIGAMEGAMAGVTADADSHREVFRRLVAVLVPLGATYRFVGHLEDRLDTDLRAVLSAQDSELAALIAAAQTAGEVRADLPAWWVSSLFDAVIWMAWSGVAEGELPRKGAPALAFATFWRGVQA